MELDTAKKIHALINGRELILKMRADAVSNNKMEGWSFMIDDYKYPIRPEIMQIFLEAIDRSIDFYETQIEKL